MKPKKPSPKNPIFDQLFESKPSRGDLKKFRLIEAAIEFIAKNGAHLVTYESIGSKLGMSRSNVLYHFPNLEDLIEGAIKYIVATAQQVTIERVQTASDWRGQVDGYINGAFDWIERFPEHGSLLMLFYHLCTVKKSYREMQTSIREAGARRIAAILSQNPKLAANADMIGVNVQALVSGRILDMVTFKPRTEWSSIREETRDAAFAIIEALGTTKP